MAGADGELSAERQLELSRQMARDPRTMARVLQQQELRRACARVLASEASPCPASLRQQVEALAADADTDADKNSGGVTASRGDEVAELRGWPRRVASPGLLGWVGPMAAAAAVALTLWAVLPGGGSGGGGRGGRGGEQSVSRGGAAGLVEVLPAGMAQRFGERHRQCGQDPSLLYEHGLYPRDLDQLGGFLAGRIAGELGGAALDLSGMGYHYDRAGSCTLPGREAAHLVYRNAAGDALSLWVKAYDGRPTLEPGVAYSPPGGGDAAVSMVVWREGQTVFYLVGDRVVDVQRARPAIHL